MSSLLLWPVVLQICFWLPEVGSLLLLLTLGKLPKEFSLSAWHSGIVPIYTRIAACPVFGRKCRWSMFWICSKYVKSFIRKQVPALSQVRLCYVLELWQKTSQTRFWHLSWDLKDEGGVSQLRSRRSASRRHSVFKGPEVGRSLVPWGKKKGWWG